MWPNKRAPESKISMADRFKMTLILKHFVTETK